MKIVVQRVKSASCTVNNQIISEINQGYLLLVGFKIGDTLTDVKALAKKVANLRIFEDELGKLNKNIVEMNYDILSISQFTLYGDTSSGNRPSFTKALEPIVAEELYLEFSDILNKDYNIKTVNGAFGFHMDIELVNDGPVTIILESK